VIEIAPGVQVTMLRRAVMEVVSDDQADQPMPETIDETEHSDPAPADDWEFKDDGTSSQDADAKDHNV
jgi:hypothetical protein